GQRGAPPVRAVRQVDPFAVDQFLDAPSGVPNVAAIILDEQGKRGAAIDSRVSHAARPIAVSDEASQPFKGLPPERRVAAAQRNGDPQAKPWRGAHHLRASTRIQTTKEALRW